MRRAVRILLALLSGLLLAAAWPTKGFAPLIFVALVPLIFLQDYIGNQQVELQSRRDSETTRQRDNKTTRQRGRGSVFGLSFITFLVWNTLTTWWVWNSTPAGAVAMLLLNSALMAFFFWLYHFTRKNVFKNKNGFFLLILSFLSLENLHYNWQLNWPWLTLGNVFSHNHTWIQWYEFTGVAGGTIWALLANILAYKFIKSTSQRVNESTSQRFSYLVIFFAVVFVPIIISKIMYNSYEEKGEEVEVVVVQPNIDPWNEEFTLSEAEILRRNFSQAQPLMTENTRFVVSPESSIHENIWLDKIDTYFSINNLKRFSKKYNDVTYIIGASTMGMTDDKDDFAARKFYDVDEYYFAYNSALSINDTSVIQIHQKSKLTPGVEMMPSWWFLRPIRNLAIDLGGIVGTLKSDDKTTIFTYKDSATQSFKDSATQQLGDSATQSFKDSATQRLGDSATQSFKDSATQRLGDSATQYYKVAPMICYESVFGDYVTEFVREGANMIFVITNDGWWGNTPGHRQHFEMSKLRAIENRRSIARSANTGISGFINQRGDVVERTNYWEPAALRNVVRVNEDMTFYSKHGDYLYRIGTFVAILVLCFSVVTSILKKKV